MTLRWLYVVAFVSTLILCGASANAQVSACPFNMTNPARGAVSDTLLQQRFAQNLSGDAAFVSGTGATSTSASSIRGNIQTLLPRLDLDGDGQITNFDSQVAARIRLGYTMQAAVAGLAPAAAGSRNTVALVTAFLNAGCPAPSSSVNPLVSYDFTAGDQFVSKSGWEFLGAVGPLAPVPGTSDTGLRFRYPGWPVDSQSYDNGTCAWREQGARMPAAAQAFYLEMRLHIPANYEHRTDMGIKIAPNGGSIDTWQIGDRVRSADGQFEATISGFGTTGTTMPDYDGIEGKVVFLRNAGCAGCNFAWVGQVQNLARNYAVTTNLRRIVSANNKLMAVFADGYSGGGNGPTIIWEYWPNDPAAAQGQTPRSSELAVHYSRGQFTGAGSHLQGTHFIGPADFGKYIDIMFHGRFSSAPGANDGVIETWIRRQGAASFTRIHHITDANMDKRTSSASPNALVPWQQSKIMGWANSCFDAQTDFYISKIKYYDQRPSGF
jgi:hypothetical protein